MLSRVIDLRAPQEPVGLRARLVDPAGVRTRFVRYCASSGLASLVSAAMFALVYRWLEQGPRAATVTAVVTGALVNFTANRFWSWGRRQRLGLGRDAVAYAALVTVTALTAAVVTSLTHVYLRVADPNLRAVLVEASYFATYAALFLIKFAILDRVVFRSRHQVPSTTRA
jgi:putative flippase GtrA